MQYLIKETKYDCFFCGCYDYSEFNDPYHMSFGSDYDAEYYYSLDYALKVVDFILNHETFWKKEELRIYIVETNETLTIEEAKLRNKKES